MSIGFRVKTDEVLTAGFCALNDEQLIESGKRLRDFAKPRPGFGPDEDWLRQLKLARAEWQRRHPKSR